MKKSGVFWTMILVFIFSAATVGNAGAEDFSLNSPQLNEGGTMDMAHIFNGFGCAGKNISPELRWTGTPAGAKSLALTVYDPDAPTGSGWWHWVVFNIDPKTTHLPANAGDVTAKLCPEGSIQSRTDFGSTGYGGACPPAGDKPHRYIFTLFALDVAQLPLDENTPAAMVGFYLNQHVIDKAQLTVLYSR